MKTIDDIFIVRNGLTTTGLEIFRVPEEGRIRFLRPASTQPRTIAGWIDKAALSEGDIFPSDSLYVSTNGEGSHSYSYVSSFEFACNSDVSILIPKEPMTIQEKLFYAQCKSIPVLVWAQAKRFAAKINSSPAVPQEVESRATTSHVGIEATDHSGAFCAAAGLFVQEPVIVQSPP
jgi:hypothetical protein